MHLVAIKGIFEVRYFCSVPAQYHAPLRRGGRAWNNEVSMIPSLVELILKRSFSSLGFSLKKIPQNPLFQHSIIPIGAKPQISNLFTLRK